MSGRSLEALVVFALAILAIVDAGFAGFRDAAGRNPRIRKEAYYRRAVRRGLRAGVVGALVMSMVAAILLASSRDPGATSAELAATARPMVWSFGVYATLVLLALGVWLAAEADLRTLASVIILGPFTLVRPWWIAITAVVAAVEAPSARAAVAAIAASAVQLAIAPWLDRGWRRGVPEDLSG